MPAVPRLLALSAMPPWPLRLALATTAQVPPMEATESIAVVELSERIQVSGTIGLLEVLEASAVLAAVVLVTVVLAVGGPTQEVRPEPCRGSWTVRQAFMRVPLAAM